MAVSFGHRTLFVNGPEPIFQVGAHETSTGALCTRSTPLQLGRISFRAQALVKSSGSGTCLWFDEDPTAWNGIVTARRIVCPISPIPGSKSKQLVHAFPFEQKEYNASPNLAIKKHVASLSQFVRERTGSNAVELRTIQFMSRTHN